MRVWIALSSTRLVWYSTMDRLVCTQLGEGRVANLARLREADTKKSVVWQQVFIQKALSQKRKVGGE